GPAVRKRVPAGLARGVLAARDAAGVGTRERRGPRRISRQGRGTLRRMSHAARHVERRGQRPLSRGQRERPRERGGAEHHAGPRDRAPVVGAGDRRLSRKRKQADGDVAGSLMGEIIQGTATGYKDLTLADRTAIAQYLKSIPAVRNRI